MIKTKPPEGMLLFVKVSVTNEKERRTKIE